MSGFLFSRGPGRDIEVRGDHLGIGGSRNATGHLFFANGNQAKQITEGRTTIEPRTWNHLVLVRDREKVRVYLNGHNDPELSGNAASDPQTPSKDWFFAGRNDNSSNLEGKLSEAAIYDRALAPDEVHRHFEAAGTP